MQKSAKKTALNNVTRSFHPTGGHHSDHPSGDHPQGGLVTNWKLVVRNRKLVMKIRN